MFLTRPLVTALDVVSLTMTLVNIESVSGAESELADQLEEVLRDLPHLSVERLGDTVVARTELGHLQRVALVGHIDTASFEAESLPARVEMGKLYGPGACEAKGGIAIMLKVAALGRYGRDVTLVFAAATDAGRAPWTEAVPELAAADVTLLVAPTDARVVVDGDGQPGSLVDLDITALSTGRRDDATASPSYGPGDPRVARTQEEFVPTAQLTECEHAVRTWVQAGL